MDFILFIVVLIGLWFVFYCRLGLLPIARLRTIPGIRSLNEMTREYLLEIADCAVAGLAAALIALVAVWCVAIFQ
jgi:hypothetical protein